MGNAKRYFPLLATAGLMASGAAQAALWDRGGGLLYDDVLNITWLQDANYAKTSGHDANGRMNWADANTWAANLVYHDSVRGVDYRDWRLPRNDPVGSDWNYFWASDGSADIGYNITSPNSELAYMYYINLGLKGYWSPTGDLQPDYGIIDTGPVKNLQSNAYWSATAYAPVPSWGAWHFSFGHGYQGLGYWEDELQVWAVRSGDVAAVPEPETYALFLAGLAVMGGVLRRRRGFGPS